jgi:prophage regulatory protein
MASLPTGGFIRLRDVLKIIPFSRSTVWRKCQSGDFPAPVKLSERITAWRVTDIQTWLDSKGRA